MNTLTSSVTIPGVNPFAELVAELRSGKGCRFVQIRYTAKGTGEVANHTLAMGVNLDRAYRRDEKIINLTRPQTDLGREAKAAVLASVQETITKGVGNNSAYTQKDTYETVAPGIKYHKETFELYVYGFSIRKNVVTPGVYKTVKSAPLTLEKDKLRKKLKMGRFRQFIVRNVERAALNGTVLELDTI
jgi:hypothetical protein